MVDVLSIEPDPEPDIPQSAVQYQKNQPVASPQSSDKNQITKTTYNEPNSVPTSQPDYHPVHLPINAEGDNVKVAGTPADSTTVSGHGRKPSIVVTEPSEVPTAKSTSQSGRPRIGVPDGAAYLRVRDFAAAAPTKAWNVVANTVGAVQATATKGAAKVPLPSSIERKEKGRSTEMGQGGEKRSVTGVSTRKNSRTNSDPESNKKDDDRDENGNLIIIEPTYYRSFINTMKAQPLLFIMPILLPVSWALHFTHQEPAAVFTVSLLAVVPLASGLSFATEELAHRLGDAWGGLLNATFGNAVELLISILALVDGQLDIVQASMIGSILSNILLVLGMSYFAGGLRFHEQMYGIAGAQMHISLLGVTLIAIVLPAAYHLAFPSTIRDAAEQVSQGFRPPEGRELANLLAISRGLSIILLIMYGMFLTFQLYTHAYLFRIPREPPVHPLPGPQPHHQSVFPVPSWVPSIIDSSTTSASSIASRSVTSLHDEAEHRGPFKRLRRWSLGTHKSPNKPPRSGTIPVDDEETTVEGLDLPSPVISPTVSPGAISPGGPTSILRAGSAVSLHSHHSGMSQHSAQRSYLGPTVDLLAQQDQELAIRQQIAKEDHKHHMVVQPKVRIWFAVGMLCLMTALAGVTAEWLVESIDGLTETGNVSREFVGLILLPVIGNSVEHITAVTVSVKDKLNLSMSIAVGSSIQVSLCILPILVLLGWAIGQPMMLFFDVFETIIIVIAVLLVNFAISDGRTNWLEGATLMLAYVSIALVAWYYDPLFEGQ